jgi:2-hydroxy-6-oxonona-2,4-dienedioate hydrolase
MSSLAETTIDASGTRTRVLRGGPQDAPAILFLHGGIPGGTPYCSGAHIWGETTEMFAERRHVVVPDLPGSGGTVPTAPPTMTSLTQHLLALLSALKITRVDVVGHDLGGLIGIALALEHPARVASLAVVSSATMAPTADGLDNILLAAPPRPLWERESQAWVFERLSYCHGHITPALLDACVAAGQGEAHRMSLEMAKSGNALAASMARTRYALWDACRNKGVPVATQIVWASHDPATTRDQAYVLFKTIAERQTATQMHVINRSGSFPFREQPESFHHVVSAFQDGVRAESGVS